MREMDDGMEGEEKARRWVAVGGLERWGDGKKERNDDRDPELGPRSTSRANDSIDRSWRIEKRKTRSSCWFTAGSSLTGTPN
jgi:hypothetical protein